MDTQQQSPCIFPEISELGVLQVIKHRPWGDSNSWFEEGGVVSRGHGFASWALAVAEGEDWTMPIKSRVPACYHASLPLTCSLLGWRGVCVCMWTVCLWSVASLSTHWIYVFIANFELIPRRKQSRVKYEETKE